MTEITKIEVNWMHGYGNAPTLEVHVDKRPDHNDFVYMALKTNVRVDTLSGEQMAVVNAGIPLPVGALKTDSPLVLNVTNADTNPTLQDWREEGNIFLLSTNLNPWIRYVSIADPKGSPTSHGALGGTYKLTDGTVFNSRTGWSSSDSQVNKLFRDFVPEHSYIIDVTLVEPRPDDSKYTYPMRWAGYALTIDHLDELYRASDNSLWPTFGGNKINIVRAGNVWIPSIDNYPGTKPPAPPK